MIIYRRDARADILRHYAWYLARDERLLDRFEALVHRTEKRIAARPLMFPPTKDRDARKCLMRFGRSVYVIYFLVEGDDQIILRVWHGREARR